MPKRLRPHLTYANVMATIAVFVALGGSGYAAVTISGKNIKQRSIPRTKIKRNSLTGAEIRESRLKRVRSARNADTVDGQDASDLKLRCPGGTRAHAAACIETGARLALSWRSAASTCGRLDRQLPTLSMLESFRREPGIALLGPEWTSNTYDASDDDTAPRAQLIGPLGEITSLDPTDAGNTAAYRCAARPSN